MEKAALLYDACYTASRAGRDVDLTVDTGLKLTAALDKTGSNHQKIAAVHKECLALSTASGNWVASGRIYMGEAHAARYRAYDSKLAFEMVRKAQDAFQKGGASDLELHACWMELSLLDPEANAGADADLKRFLALYERSAEGYAAHGRFDALVNLHIFAYQMLAKYERLDLVESSLQALLATVKQHFPSDYERNLEGVKGICQSLGIKFSQ